MNSSKRPERLPLSRLVIHARQLVLPALLLASLGCSTARSQSLAGFRAEQALEAPAPHPVAEFCFLSPRELCSGKSSSEPQNSPQQASESGFKTALKRFGKDQAGIYSVPFRRSSLKWDALFLAGTGLFIATDKHAIGAISGDHIDVSRRISEAGLYGTSAAAGVLWISGIATHNGHAREAGALSAEALANTLPVYAVLKLSLGRERPNQGNGNGQFFANNGFGSAFPSGHALFAWSMASVIAHEYPRPWVKWLAYGTATAVSLTRFTGREHFPADVVVGSVFGYLIGRHIFKTHCTEGLSADCHNHEIIAAN
jgi:membrane-associated phospholipid phosphatase